MAVSDPIRAALERAFAHGMIGGDLDDHVRHAHGFVAAYDQVVPDLAPSRIADLGSGGGLPGLILADHWPQAQILLTETRRTRADGLMQTQRSLGWSETMTVWSGDVQEAAVGEYRAWADLVTARSFGPPAMVAECAAGLLRVGGWLIVSEPPEGNDDSDDSLRWPEAGLAELGFSVANMLEAGARFAAIGKVAPTPDQFPRRRRTMERRPLWRDQ